MLNNIIKIILLVVLITTLGLLNYTEWILITKILDATVNAKLIYLLFLMIGVELFFIAFFVPIYRSLAEGVDYIIDNTTISQSFVKGLLYTLLATVVACLILWFLVLEHL